ncbi:unnamed protein product [Prorocentrum cordatum]|uniref:Uncharacterized protein n=1 Tax=Prorocentrum cordatum TaxID=2364126 RepID=A0ABN9TIQ4_9DINO|nr:unnamed protein product [Polarella glacialis]
MQTQIKQLQDALAVANSSTPAPKPLAGAVVFERDTDETFIQVFADKLVAKPCVVEVLALFGLKKQALAVTIGRSMHQIHHQRVPPSRSRALCDPPLVVHRSCSLRCAWVIHPASSLLVHMQEGRTGTRSISILRSSEVAGHILRAVR